MTLHPVSATFVQVVNDIHGPRAAEILRDALTCNDENLDDFGNTYICSLSRAVMFMSLMLSLDEHKALPEGMKLAMNLMRSMQEVKLAQSVFDKKDTTYGC